MRVADVLADDAGAQAGDLRPLREIHLLSRHSSPSAASNRSSLRAQHRRQDRRTGGRPDRVLFVVVVKGHAGFSLMWAAARWSLWPGWRVVGWWRARGGLVERAGARGVSRPRWSQSRSPVALPGPSRPPWRWPAGRPRPVTYGIPNRETADVASAVTRTPERTPVKPAPFIYHRTRDVVETVGLLTELGTRRRSSRAGRASSR